MVRGLGQWLDRHWWSIPVAAFVTMEAMHVFIYLVNGPHFALSLVEADRRREIYSSLTGSSSGLLGFTLAAIAILVAFGKRAASDQETRGRENHLAEARLGICKVLLVTSVFLVIILIASTVSMGIDDREYGNVVLTSIVTSSALSSLLGVVISGAGLTLALMEKSRND